MSTTAPSFPLGTTSFPSGAATTSLSPAAPGADKAKIARVARQFEAIFVRQMLAEARKTSFDNGQDTVLGHKDQTFREMQDARFADIAADKGTFGLARMIEKQLLARSGGQGSASAPAAAAGKEG